MNGVTRDRDTGAPKKGFSAKEAASGQGHVAITSGLPFPIVNGFRLLPSDVKEAARFITERSAPWIRAHWQEQVGDLEMRSQLLMPGLMEIKGI